MGEECARSAPAGEAPLQSSELPALLSTCWLLKVAGNLQTWHSLRRVVRRRERKRREKAGYVSGGIRGGPRRGAGEKPECRPEGGQRERGCRPREKGRSEF